MLELSNEVSEAMESGTKEGEVRQGKKREKEEDGGG